MKITFTREEKDFVKEAARFRTIANENTHNIAAYNPRYMRFNDESADLISVASEAAVVKAFGYDLTKTDLKVWPAFYLPKHKGLYDGGDLNHNGIKYEVRRTNLMTAPLVIRRKDLTDGGINIKVFIGYEVNQKTGSITGMDDFASLVGYIDSNEGWGIGEIPEYNGYPETNARCVRNSQLHTDFEELINKS